MNTYSDKSQNNKSRSAAEESAQKKEGNESPFRFADNRTETVTQRRMQQMAHNSAQTKNTAVLQAMTARPQPKTSQHITNGVSSAPPVQLRSITFPDSETIDTEDYTESELNEMIGKTFEPDSDTSWRDELNDAIEAGEYKPERKEREVKRKSRPRVAKSETRGKRNPPRGSEKEKKERTKRGRDADDGREIDKSRKVHNNMQRGVFIDRKTRDQLIEKYKEYPPGSYAHGRWLYLTGQLEDLASSGSKGLLDFDHAPIEVDHSPTDGSQRPGERKEDEASLRRVAVPLPRKWHRRHKTTRGGKHLDIDFSGEQRQRVEDGKYAEALQLHLLETFSDQAMLKTGEVKVRQVAGHVFQAIDYAASKIETSLFPGHEENTPAISSDEQKDVTTAITERLAKIWKDRDFTPPPPPDKP